MSSTGLAHVLHKMIQEMASRNIVNDMVISRRHTAPSFRVGNAYGKSHRATFPWNEQPEKIHAVGDLETFVVPSTFLLLVVQDTWPPLRMIIQDFALFIASRPNHQLLIVCAGFMVKCCERLDTWNPVFVIWFWPISVSFVQKWRVKLVWKFSLLQSLHNPENGTIWFELYPVSPTEIGRNNEYHVMWLSGGWDNAQDGPHEWGLNPRRWPSTHEVKVGKWVTTKADLLASRKPGFGMTIIVRASDVGCGHGKDPRMHSRISHHSEVLKILTGNAVANVGENLDCGLQGVIPQAHAAIWMQAAQMTQDANCRSQMFCTRSTAVRLDNFCTVSFNFIGLFLAISVRGIMLETP